MEPTNILDQAQTAIDRGAQQHGSGELLFTTIAERWSLSLMQRHGVAIALTPADVAFLMVDFKMARAITAPGNTDNPVDIAGYAALLGGFTAPK